MKSALISASLLALLAGSAVAQPVVDGVLDESGIYGERRWSQNQPTTFGNNAAASVGGDPAAVTTGIEVAIPLSKLGSPTFPIKVTAAIVNGGHYNMSNQVVGGLAGNTPALGPTKFTDFSTIAGNQFATVNPTGSLTPVLDGTRDAGYQLVFVQNNFSSRNDNVVDLPGNRSGGSEIDALWVAKDANNLYLFFAGNVTTNFDDAFDLYIDSVAGGQNQILNTNADINFNNLNNNVGGDGSPGNPGLKFDAGFEADSVIFLNGGNNPAVYYADFATLPTGGGGTGQFLGGGAAPTGEFNTISNADGTTIAINNSNVNGVTGVSIPSDDYANGSELNNLYGYVDPSQGTLGRLYLFVGGNFESNYNKFCVLLDVDGNPESNEGQNELLGNNVDISFNKLNRLGVGGNGATPANPSGGLKLDPQFAADYWLFPNTNGTDMYTDAAVLRTGGKRVDPDTGNSLDYGAYSGGTKPASNANSFLATNRDVVNNSANIYTNMGPRLASAQAPLTPGLITFAIDNRNIGGVNGPDNLDFSDSPNVIYGAEISIDLEEAGWDGVSPIKVAGFIINDPADFVSNQVIGGLPTPANETYAPNLGEPTFVDFSAIDGAQYVSLCRGDVNDDNVTDFGDFLAFFNAFDVSAPDGDLNGDFSTDFGDFLAFFNAYDVGC
jgi:hypothetical protein